MRRAWLAGIVLCGLLAAAAAAAFLIHHTGRYDPLITQAAERHALDFHLVKAVVCEESWFRAGARGPHGEVGLMQITRAAAADFARRKGIPEPNEIQLLDPGENLEIGCWYLRDSLDRYRNSPSPALFALLRYNAGAARADAWLSSARARAIPEGESAENHCLSAVSIASTQSYVRRIMRRQRSRFYWF